MTFTLIFRFFDRLPRGEPVGTGSTNTSRSVACVMAPQRSLKEMPKLSFSRAMPAVRALPCTVQCAALGSGVAAATSKGEPGSGMPKLEIEML